MSGHYSQMDGATTPNPLVVNPVAAPSPKPKAPNPKRRRHIILLAPQPAANEEQDVDVFYE